MTLPTLVDIEAGAWVFLNTRAENRSPVEKAAHDEFMIAMDAIHENEWDIRTIAFLLTGQDMEAGCYLENKITDAQPEPDHFGEAADRGYDERKERGEA